MKEARITIIGLGRVGTALLRVLSEKGYTVMNAFNRSGVDADLKKNHPQTKFISGLPDKGTILGDWIFLSVSDDAIPSVVDRLIDQSRDLNKNVVHLSGSHSSKVLAPLKNAGASIASFHPMKAITPTTTSLEGTWFDLEGDEELLKSLEELAQDLDAHSFRVEPDAKPLLHASAVVASNYLVVLAELVSKISAEANIPEEIALKALTPLMENTLQNISEMGVTDALTGPIARGDVKTIKQHLQNLNNAPDLCSLYKTLGLEAVKIAEKKSGESQSLQEIKKLLS
jgi:predicted short-subunit dehydrogenase-like oxidoreductase (DUF2520 family)